MGKKFPEHKIRTGIHTKTNPAIYFDKDEVDECLKQHSDEWNIIRRKARKLNFEDGFNLMYGSIINYLEALPK